MISQSNTILCLAVGRKQPHHQVRYTVWALNLQPLMGRVYKSLYHHPLLVGRILLGSIRTAGAEDHPNYLTGIGLEPHPFEQPGEGLECPL